MARKILHLDLDAFFVAVEERRDASLRGRPVAVGGQPGRRGVVASCSYAARQYGIHSAMPMAQAVRLCPDLIIISHDFGAYREASLEVMARLDALTPQVEQISIDEAFLDVTLYPQPARDIARQLQARIRADLRLPCSLGGAGSKLVAKIANNVGKARAGERAPGQPPCAVNIIAPGDETRFLAGLPIRELWGVGPKTAGQLEGLGIKTIGDLARWPEDDLVRRFGKHGHDLARHARGIDTRPVEALHETKSISREITFSRDETDGEALRRVLRRLADSVGRQARKQGLRGTTVKIKLRWADFTTLTRQRALDYATAHDDEIYAAAEQLFERNWPRGRPVRLIGVGISGFDESGRQLGLWEDFGAIEQSQRLQATLDELRDRFGDEAVQRGSQLKRGSSVDFPRESG